MKQSPSTSAPPAAGSPEPPGRLPSFWTLRRFLPVALLMAMGLSFFIALFYLVRTYEKKRQAENFTRLANARINAFMRRKEHDLESLMSVGHFFAASHQVDSNEFSVFVQGPLQWHPEIVAIAWFPSIPAAMRPDFERAHRLAVHEIDDEDARRPARMRDTYFPLLFQEYTQWLPDVPGWDLGSDAISRQTMTKALEAANGRMIASPRLLIGNRTGTGAAWSGVRLLLPIYFKLGDEELPVYHPTNLAGFVSAMLRPSAMLKEALATGTEEPLDVYLIDQSSQERPALLEFHSGAGPAAPPPAAGLLLDDWDGPEERATVDMAGRRWTVICRPAAGYSEGINWESWSVLLGGWLLTMLLSTYLYTLLGQNAYIENVVTRRTRELAGVNVRLQNEMGERERGERALRDSEALYHSLVDTVPMSIIRKNRSGQILFGNKRYCETINQPLAKVIGKTDYDLFPKQLADKYVADDRQVIETRRIFEDVEEHRKPDGTLTYVQVLKAPVVDAMNEVVGTQVIFWDVTERKRAEEDLKQTLSDLARSNRDLEQFAYVASHDLQEPLRMIASYTELLRKRYGDSLDAEAREFIQFAVEGAVRMQALINDLLAYSRLGTRGVPFAVVRTEVTLRGATRNLQVAIDEQCALVTHDPLPDVFGDAVQLIQVWQNLLSNALKFHGADSPKIHITAHRRLSDVLFAVQDNGLGIAPEHAERIFVIFQRLHSREKYSGTGIGLAICKKIIERHGGRIWVESRPGLGATFFFTLPPPAP